jgi:transketolase
LPFQKRDAATIKLIDKGAYILSEAADGNPQAIIIATGSEVALAMAAQKTLAAEGIQVRVVSMPCTNLFDRQDQAYKESVLPTGINRVAVEAGVADYWYKYVGFEGEIIGIDTFGESAPAEVLFKYFGFTVENVIEAVKRII